MFINHLDWVQLDFGTSIKTHLYIYFRMNDKQRQLIILVSVMVLLTIVLLFLFVYAPEPIEGFDPDFPSAREIGSWLLETFNIFNYF